MTFRASIRPFPWTLWFFLSALSVRGELKWPTPALTVHAARPGEKVHAAIPFINTGKTTVRITDLVASCECTSAVASAPQFKPGESGEVQVATVARHSTTQTTVRVLTDDGAPAQVLAMTVQVPASVLINPSRVFWDVNAPVDEKRIELTFDPQQVAVRGHLYPDSLFHVTLEATDQPGRMFLKIKPATQNRVAQATIRIDTVVAGTPRAFIAYAAVK